VPRKKRKRRTKTNVALQRGPDRLEAADVVTRCGERLACQSVGRRGFSAAACSSHGAQGKKLVAAGRAAERGNPEYARKNRTRARDMLGANALQIETSADVAAGVKEVAERDAAREKARFAGRASPGQNSRQAEKIVGDGAAPGTPGIRGVTSRAYQRAGTDGRPPTQA